MDLNQLLLILHFLGLAFGLSASVVNLALLGLMAGADPAEARGLARVPPVMAQVGGSGLLLLWATGFKPDYGWLEVPVLDRKGGLRHEGGVADAPGMYVMGLPFLRRRKSSFIHGAEDDARALAAHLAGYLDAQVRGCRERVALQP